MRIIRYIVLFAVMVLCSAAQEGDGLMHYAVRSSSPYGSYTDPWRIRPTRWYLSLELNKPGRLIMFLDDKDMLDDLIDETDKSNPLQLRSSVSVCAVDEIGDAIQDDDWMFDGRVHSREITQKDGNTTIRVEALDLLGHLKETYPQVDTPPYAPAFYSTPEYFQATDIDMIPLKAGHATYKYWFFPDTSETQAWCPVSGAYATVYTQAADAVIAQAATTIKTNKPWPRRMKQRGIIKIVDAKDGDEYVYYDGYGLDSTGSVYEFRNCVRGCLGTADVLHNTHLLELRQFVPARMYIENSDWSLGYDTLPKGSIRIIPHPEDGYFEFTGVSVVPTNVTGTYKYLNENDAAGHDGGTSFWLLEDVIENVLEDTVPLGPVLVAANYDIEVPDIVIPATEEWGCDCLTFILKMLDERGLTGHIYDASYINEHPRLGVYCKFGSAVHHKVYVGAIAQSNSSAVVWPGFTSVKYKYTMDNTYTAVAVVYTDTGTNARLARIMGLTNSHAATDYDKVYDADAWDKYRGYGNGYGRVKVIERGEMSAGEATALAEAELRQGLVLPDSRVYEVDQFPDRSTLTGVDIGDTIYMPDGFYGVLTRFDLRCENGVQHATLYLTDTLTGVT